MLQLSTLILNIISILTVDVQGITHNFQLKIINYNYIAISLVKFHAMFNVKTISIKMLMATTIIIMILILLH